MAEQLHVDELQTKMANERAALVAAAQGLRPGDELRVPVDAEGEEQWTALEQLAHLSEMESSYVAWVGAALAIENPDLAAVRGEPVAVPIEDANGHTVDEMLAILARQRDETLDLIRNLKLDDFDRVATSPMFGTLSVLQWLRSFYRHDRQHAAQIQGRQSDYVPNFRGKEPNQRQARLDQVARRGAGRAR